MGFNLEVATIDELLTALDRNTPRIVPAGAIVLQPSDERRRSGSHYTPRSLTEPIVRTTLEPILRQLTNHRGTEKKQERKRKTRKSDSSQGELEFENQV